MIRRAALLLVLAAAAAAPAAAQEANTRKELRESQLRLDQIRQEREKLQREMTALQSRVRDASAELRNIDRQVATSARALREVEFQFNTLETEIEETSAYLTATRAQLNGRRGMLGARLRTIYKRGPMHATRVLLSAQDFGDLLNRYRYVHVIALHDRALITDVERLERTLVRQERELRQNMAQLEILREEKSVELAHLRELEAHQSRTLTGYRQREKQTEGRLQQLARDEASLKDVIAELERKRREAERRSAAAGRPSAGNALTTRDRGSLPWPLEGELVYRFGVDRRPNGVVLRNNGIGIRAPAGTQVKVVEAGRVDMARPFEGYGPSVIVSHGGGFYTLYHYLGRLNVREGQQIAAGHVIGTVGEARGTEATHIEFRVHVPVSNALPEPVDPLLWLRAPAR